jgi:hypothetical protein
MLIVGFAVVIVTRPELLAWGLTASVIAVGVLVGLAQPGTLLYATPEHVGHRTILLTRYEVPRSAVVAIEVAYVSIDGSPLKTIVFVDRAGRQLLRSYSANYDTGELERFAGSTGIDFRP